jgi:hypothetical protein
MATKEPSIELDRSFGQVNSHIEPISGIVSEQRG